MCGISGIFIFNKKNPVKKKDLLQMNYILNHRGPDGNGIWISMNHTHEKSMKKKAS